MFIYYFRHRAQSLLSSEHRRQVQTVQLPRSPGPRLFWQLPMSNRPLVSHT
jgi:hypothetical protein